MKKKNKNKKKYLIFIPILLFVAATFVLVYLASQNIDLSKLVTIKYKDSNSIVITSTLPISDTLGKKLDGLGTEEGVQGYSEISIKNKSNLDVTYEIYITKKEGQQEINSNYIKFYLTDNVDNPIKGFEKNMIPTYNDFSVLIDKPKSRLLYKDKIKASEEKKFILRSWLADNYGISDEKLEFSFTIGVRTK